MSEILIHYQNVEIDRKKKSVIHSVNFKQKRGEFVYIVGEVGSGKSSFLKTLYCDLPINVGTAFVYDYNLKKIKKKHIPALRRRLGIIFQDFQLLIDRSVVENLKFVLKATGWKKKNAINDRVQEVLIQVGMENKDYKMPYELSRGEQQKIAIARALLNFPEIILADEPTGNLDMESACKIVQLLQDVNKRGTAVVMATHNYSLVEKFPSKTKKCEGKHFFDYELI